MFRFFKWLFGSKKSSPSDEKEAPAPTFEAIQQKKPETLTREEIVFLKKLLDDKLKSLAEAKAISIRTNRAVEADKQTVDEYERKAMALQRYAENGKLPADEAEHLIAETLHRRNEVQQRLETQIPNKQKYDAIVSSLEKEIQEIKPIIRSWEIEKSTIRDPPRRDATQRIDRTNDGSSGDFGKDATMNMLQKMKEETAEKLQTPLLEQLKQKMNIHSYPAPSDDSQNAGNPPSDNP